MLVSVCNTTENNPASYNKKYCKLLTFLLFLRLYSTKKVLHLTLEYKVLQQKSLKRGAISWILNII